MDKITRMKTLRSYTIIPNELYVERSADTHLQRTIVDMGRPGYILVARQMGKTNLLLHTKRKLSNSLNEFLYIDISNTFPDIRYFFQNIIDTFLDSHPDINVEILKSIRERRSILSSLPPHKEHENELRLIIQAIEGKLVICLDEIDALIKTGYSDQVFSFIRSIYFSGRVNFPEFERLTYVLSGVADPSELIKDKALSPFNIGEKIYLNDFSRDEFNIFLQKAQLTFSDDVIDRIYYWTSGNPRVSWEICAALEDFIISGNKITAEVVDSTVTDMYLTNFDLPPIDHIRMLVEEDRIVRDAIMAIHYGKSETISDAVRNRLYLSGITKPDQSGSRKVTIRNRLLVESLSENWIQDIERRKIPLYELANRRYEEGRYEDALALYDEYIESTNAPEDSVSLYYNIGYCQFKLGRYPDAISNFEKHPIKKEEFPRLYYWMQHMLGYSYLYSGEHLKSLEFFRKILEQDINSTPLYHYFDTCLNLSSALSIDPINNIAEIRQLNQIVIDSESLIRNSTEEEHRSNHLLAIAHFNLAKLSKEIGDIESARSSIKSAKQVAEERTQVFLAIEASDIAANQEEKIQILELCVQDILDKRISVREKNKEYPFDFTVDVCTRLVKCLSENSMDQGFDKLILHLANKNVHDVSVGYILSRAVNSLSTGNSNAAVKLITKAIYLPSEEIDFESRRHLFTLWILFTPFPKAKNLVTKYWNDRIEQPNAPLVGADFRFVWELVQGYLESKDIEMAGTLIARTRNLIEKTWSQNSDNSDFEQLRAGEVLLDSLDLELELLRGLDEGFLEKSQKLLERLNGMQSLVLPYFPQGSLSRIKSNIQIIIAQSTKPISTSRRVTKKYGRNEMIRVRFEDGRIEEGKYKRFETKLNNGHCQIIDA